MRVRVLLASGAVLASLLSPVAAGAASTSPSAASGLSKAQAKKLAKAALPTKADLSGYKYERSTQDPADVQYDDALFECMGLPKPKYLAENAGAAFTKGALKIDSESSVLDTGKHAKAAFKALNTPRGATCFEHVTRTVFEDQGVTVTKLTVKLVKATVAGTGKAFGVKYDISGTVNGTPIRLKSLDLSVLVGQTEFDLTSVRYDGKGPKLDQLTALAVVLVQRIRAV